MPQKEDEIDLHYPAAGIDLSAAFQAQPNKPVAGGRYARTTPVAVNVRGYEAETQRVRGGSRPGLVKYIPVAPVAGWIIQELAVIVTTGQGAKSP